MKYSTILFSLSLFFLHLENFSMEIRSYPQTSHTRIQIKPYKKEFDKLNALTTTAKEACGASAQRKHCHVATAQQYVCTLEDLATFALQTLTMLIYNNADSDIIKKFENSYLWSRQKILTVLRQQGRSAQKRKKESDEAARRIIRDAWNVIASWGSQLRADNDFITNLEKDSRYFNAPIPHATQAPHESNQEKHPAATPQTFSHDMQEILKELTALENNVKEACNISIKKHHSLLYDTTHKYIYQIAQLIKFSYTALRNTCLTDSDQIDPKTKLELLYRLQSAYVFAHLKCAAVLIHKQDELLRGLLQKASDTIASWEKGSINYAHKGYLNTLRKKFDIYTIQPQESFPQNNSMVDLTAESMDTTDDESDTSDSDAEMPDVHIQEQPKPDKRMSLKFILN